MALHPLPSYHHIDSALQAALLSSFQGLTHKGLPNLHESSMPIPSNMHTNLPLPDASFVTPKVCCNENLLQDGAHRWVHTGHVSEGIAEMQLFVSFGAQKVKASYDFVKHDLIQHLIAGAGLCSTLSRLKHNISFPLSRGRSIYLGWTTAAPHKNRIPVKYMNALDALVLSSISPIDP
eukprot:846264-Pelagomonas_calceolata.AAC.1